MPFRFTLLVVLAATTAGCDLVSTALDRSFNQTFVAVDAPDPEDDPGLDAFIRSAFIADLHSDTLLWDRDLLAQASYGHVDLPRLRTGGVGLQVFSAVTHTPLRQAAPADARLIDEVRRRESPECILESNFSPIGLLHMIQGRDIETWTDTEARALSQAGRLRTFAARAGDDLVLVEDAGDLERLIEARSPAGGPVGAMQALEGAHWIDGDASRVEASVDRLFAAGFRMLAPTHRFGNRLAASSEGCDQLSGLTDAGRAFLLHAERLGIVVDLAHISDLGLLEALEILQEPVVISHTGLRFDCPQDVPADIRCDLERGLTEDGVRAVARNNGVIGIGYWPQAVGAGMRRISSTFRSAMAVLSEPEFVAEMRAVRPDYDPADHLALGSDFDGAVSTPFATDGIEVLFAELRRPGPNGEPPLSEGTIRRLAGANVCRVFATRLPGGSAALAQSLCSRLVEADDSHS